MALDWSQMDDAQTERCGLLQLHAATLERLLGEGYVIVAEAQPRSIRLRFSSEGATSFGARADASWGRRELRFELPDDCDATFVLLVIDRMVDALSQLTEERPPLPVEQEPRPVEPPPPEPMARAYLDIDATLRAHYTPALLVGGGLGVGRHWPNAWSVGARLELVGIAHDGVRLLEPSAALVVGYRPDVVGFVAELGPVLHVALSDLRTVVEPDAMVALGMQISARRFFAHLLIFVRFRAFEHVRGPEQAVDTGFAGLAFRLGGKLLRP